MLQRPHTLPDGRASSPYSPHHPTCFWLVVVCEQIYWWPPKAKVYYYYYYYLVVIISAQNQCSNGPQHAHQWSRILPHSPPPRSPTPI